MTQWWRLLYDAGHKPVTWWLSDFEQAGDTPTMWGEDHLGRNVFWSSESAWIVQEIDELPPKQRKEREEVLGDG